MTRLEPLDRTLRTDIAFLALPVIGWRSAYTASGARSCPLSPVRR